MTDHIYKKIEITGTSRNSIEEAVQNALARARQTLKSLRWFEVTEIRGDISDASVEHWQVTLKVGFTLQDTVE
jgi:dodecin